MEYPNPSEITKEGDIKEMCGIFGYDHLRFKQSIDSRNFGEECFEFDMASNNIKRFERGWNGKISKDLLDRIKDSALILMNITSQMRLHSHTILCSTIQIIQSSIGRELQMDMC